MRGNAGWVALVLGGALALAGCGGGETKTVVQTVVQQAPATPAPAAPAPTATTTAPATAPAAPGAPLPAGVTAVRGTYDMDVRDSDYAGNANTTGDDAFPTESEWPMDTQCTGTECTLSVRRELESGAYKNYTLQADPDREGVYVGTSTGRTTCAVRDDEIQVRQRLSVRVTATRDVGGVPTAGRVDVYYVETGAPGAGNRCEFDPDVRVRSTTSWRGELDDGTDDD